MSADYRQQFRQWINANTGGIPQRGGMSLRVYQYPPQARYIVPPGRIGEALGLCATAKERRWVASAIILSQPFNFK